MTPVLGFKVWAIASGPGGWANDGAHPRHPPGIKTWAGMPNLGSFALFWWADAARGQGVHANANVPDWGQSVLQW